MSDVVRITDPDDARVDDFRRLNDQRFRRSFEGDELFIAEGFVAIDRLLEADHHVRAVLVAPSRLDRFAGAAAILATRGVAVHVAEPDVIAAIVGFDLHRGVLASASRRRLPSLDEVMVTAQRIAVLEGLNDPENLGAIARAARAFRIDALVIDPTCTDPYSRRTVRVSMGEVLHLPVARAHRWPGAIDTLRAGGFETWAMTPAADSDDVWQLPVPAKVAVLLGAEGAGLSRAAIEAADRAVHIPISPSVDSLNVGHAAAVTFAIVSR